MYTVYIAMMLIPLAAIILINIRKQRMKNRGSESTGKGTIYERERNIALNITPNILKLNIPDDETLVYGVVMDMDIGEGFMTLACYITGAANLHFSSGSGIRGGGKNPSVGEAGVEFVTGAQEFLELAKGITFVPVPVERTIQFCLLTNKGKYLAQEPMSSLQDSSSSWIHLFDKGSKVIAEMHKGGV